jgi:hypothetical protein
VEPDVIGQLADALAAGQIAGVFRGRAEAGPRVLATLNPRLAAQARGGGAFERPGEVS